MLLWLNLLPVYNLIYEALNSMVSTKLELFNDVYTVLALFSNLDRYKMTQYRRIFCINIDLTIHKHQHHKYCKQVGGNFKFSVLEIFYDTPHVSVSY